MLGAVPTLKATEPLPPVDPDRADKLKVPAWSPRLIVPVAFAKPPTSDIETDALSSLVIVKVALLAILIDPPQSLYSRSLSCWIRESRDLSDGQRTVRKDRECPSPFSCGKTEVSSLHKVLLERSAIECDGGVLSKRVISADRGNRQWAAWQNIFRLNNHRAAADGRVALERSAGLICAKNDGAIEAGIKRESLTV